MTPTKVALLVMLGCLSVLVAVFWPLLCVFLPGQHPGAVTDSWRLPGEAFDLRLDQRRENCGGFVPGSYSVFLARQAGGEWRDVVTFRHDDPVPIPSNQVVVVNSRVAYFYVGWVCAATSDGAQSWSVWDARREVPQIPCCPYGLIENVRIDGDGVGTMTLDPARGLPSLTTTDFGRTWVFHSALPN